MRFLHTSDWHVGKTLKGHNRLDEQADVLAEIVAIAREKEVDAVLLAGDVYENAAPTADAQKLVVKTLRALAKSGIEVVVIAGNHDHAATLEAYRPLMKDAGIHVYGAFRRAPKGVHRFTTKDGTDVRVAVLPFLSQRYAVRAAQIVSQTPAQNVGSYDELVRQLLADLVPEFGDDAVNIVMAHLTCTGGKMGGGEREAQTIFEYHVSGSIFPVNAHYVALGHLHRRQDIPAACPVVYSGSPLAIDFGEQDNENVVCLVEAGPGEPARVTDFPIRSGRRLRTISGTVADIVARADDYGDDFLRVWVEEPVRAGLKDDVAEALPNALEIRISPEFATASSGTRVSADHASRTPAQLFADYCASSDVDDPRVRKLFDRLNDELTHRS
jgi:exonuclease SbcD